MIPLLQLYYSMSKVFLCPAQAKTLLFPLRKGRKPFSTLRSKRSTVFVFVSSTSVLPCQSKFRTHAVHIWPYCHRSVQIFWCFSCDTNVAKRFTIFVFRGKAPKNLFFFSCVQKKFTVCLSAQLRIAVAEKNLYPRPFSSNGHGENCIDPCKDWLATLHSFCATLHSFM